MIPDHPSRILPFPPRRVKGKYCYDRQIRVSQAPVLLLAGGARSYPWAAGWLEPGRSEPTGRLLRRHLVDGDPSHPGGPLGLDDDLEVPVVVVGDRRPLVLEDLCP